MTLNKRKSTKVIEFNTLTTDVNIWIDKVDTMHQNKRRPKAACRRHEKHETNRERSETAGEREREYSVPVRNVLTLRQ